MKLTPQTLLPPSENPLFIFSLRQIECKRKIFNISDEKIAFLEIPTGNPLVIDFDNLGNVLGAKYLDESRKKEIIFNE